MDIEQTPFQLQDIVWGKIQDYPWWPGKIIQIAEHKSLLTFKVSFYADPTYCYLKEDCVIPFQDFDYSLNNSFKIDFLLQKAINLASKAHQKNKLKQQRIRCQIDKQVQIKINKYELQEKINQESQLKLEDFDQSTICYVKQASDLIKIPQKLKSSQIKEILAKYKLDNIPKLIEVQKIKSCLTSQNEIDEKTSQQQPSIRNRHKKQYKRTHLKRKYLIRKSNRNIKPLSKEQKNIQFMKKVCHLLIAKNIMTPFESRQAAIKLATKIKTLKQFQNPDEQKNMYIRCFQIITNFLENQNTQMFLAKINKDLFEEEMSNSDEKFKLTDILITTQNEQLQTVLC